jgi:meso-butanediol dehydrogenase / (S,S)-butanediol dehydrogenase / diacetyl reductase
MRTAIITGASSGIGRATALRFSKEGMQLVLTDIDETGLGALSRAIQTMHVVVPGDVASEATAQAVTETTLQRFGRIDVLINNAGVFREGAITGTRSEDLEKMFGVNVFGGIWMCKHVIPVMQQQGTGSIVNVSSISAHTSQDDRSHSQYLYNLTKACVAQLTLCLATGYAADGIRVNSVCPGVVRTGIVQHLGGPAEDNVDGWDTMARDNTPLRRAGRAEEVASGIWFLASNDASFVTGASLSIDGGFLAR